MSLKSVVLVAGVHGVSGYAAGEHWASVPGAQVYGLSRRSAPLPKGVTEIIGDLLDPGDLQRKLGKISFTHVVFGATDVPHRISDQQQCCRPHYRFLKQIDHWCHGVSWDARLLLSPDPRLRVINPLNQPIARRAHARDIAT